MVEEELNRFGLDQESNSDLCDEQDTTVYPLSKSSHLESKPLCVVNIPNGGIEIN